MSKIDKYLSDFDDYELAFFAKYKLDTYLKNSQEKIKKILFKRGLTEYRIEKLIEENPKSKLIDEKERCPRCYSDKIRRDKVKYTNESSGGSFGILIKAYNSNNEKVTYKNEVICNVCGFWLKDPNNEKPKMNITRLMSTFLTKIRGIK
ncbi:hypothetical protein SAMN06265371_106216 [Lutibacter agarilyticus]|uniref:Uncharacterized protein n=1 Tax=Lutibacter agarilyticus TaxID=1109740 RepID=A0A238XP82_9FLAO|nr:hypothetical protein [Lutibacter agarilyticus]SNR60757.1 hypothetical protein SAMN06265371_106216 [Lutibacter agarilyticus]